jgi:hypothetical protein
LRGILTQGQKNNQIFIKEQKFKINSKIIKTTTPKKLDILVLQLNVPTSYETIKPIAKNKKTRIEGFNFIFLSKDENRRFSSTPNICLNQNPTN